MLCKDAEYVLMIAKHKNISRAADELFISQPALTKYLHNLEIRENAVLFIRKNNELTPTEIGKIYIEHAFEVVDAIRRLNGTLFSMTKTKNSSLRIGFASNGIKDVFINAILLLKEKMPDVDVFSTNRFSNEIIDMVADGELDIGFVSLNSCVNKPSLAVDVIISEYLLLSAPAGHPITDGAKKIHGLPYPWIDLKKAGGESFVVTHSNSPFRSTVDEIFIRYNINPRIVMTTRSKMESLKFAESGGWMCFATSLMVNSASYIGKTDFYVFGNPVEKYPIGVVYQKNRCLNAAARKLIKILGKLLDSEFA